MPNGIIPLGAEFRVNSYTFSSQVSSQVAGDNKGGYVVTWVSNPQDGDGAGIYAQRYDADGVAIGSETLVNTYTTDHQQHPSITSFVNGGYVVVWNSRDQDGSGDGIYAQRYDSTGVMVGGEFQVNTYTALGQREPSVAATADGGFVIAYTSSGQDGDGNGIFARIYKENGAPDGPEFQVNTETASAQIYPTVTVMTDGKFVVSWASLGQDGSIYGIFAQVYQADGTTKGPEFQVNTFTNFNQSKPSVTALDDGNYVITWESALQDDQGAGVYGQLVGGDGSAIGGEFQVNTTTALSQEMPDVTGLADGGFVVTWTDTALDGSNKGIFGQRFDANGDKIGGETQINTYTTANQYDSNVSALENGGYVVTWTSDGQDGSGFGIYAQQFAAQLFGTSGDETILDNVKANWMHGQGGDDVLKGLGAKDTIKGGSGDDKLYGGKGADTLLGGADTDKLFGGVGRDKFVFKLGNGHDKIMDFQDDIDTMRLDEALWGGGLTKQQVINSYASVDGADIVFDFGTDQLRLRGFTDLSELRDDMILF